MKKAASQAHVRVPKSDPDFEADARQTCLLEIAGEVFMEQGYEAASVGEIARRVKTSKQTIYARYPSKAELFQAAIAWRAEVVYRHLSALLVFDDPPRKALTVFGTGLLEMVLDASAVGVLRLVYMESCRFPDLGKLLYDRGPGPCLGLVERYMRQQRELGRVRAADTAIAAEQLLDMITGRLVMRAALRLAPNPPAKDRKRRVKAAVDVFLAAYGSDPE